MFLLCIVITGRNEVLAKVIFLHLSVILFTGGLARRPPRLDGGTPPRMENPPGWMEEPPQMETPPAARWRTPPARWRTPPGWMENPPSRMENPPSWMEEPPQMETPGWMETPPTGWRPPGWRTPPLGSGLWHTVYDRPVRILLECILVRKVI